MPMGAQAQRVDRGAKACCPELLLRLLRAPPRRLPSDRSVLAGFASEAWAAESPRAASDQGEPDAIEIPQVPSARSDPGIAGPGWATHDLAHRRSGGQSPTLAADPPSAAQSAPTRPDGRTKH